MQFFDSKDNNITYGMLEFVMIFINVADKYKDNEYIYIRSKR